MRQSVFIVDHDLSFCMLATEECRKYGYSVRLFKAACDLTQWMTTEPERPSIFILNTEERTRDGTKLFDFVRRSEKVWLTPIILVSDYADEENCVRSLEEGADDYITKPVCFQELALRVRAILNSSTHPRSSLIQVGSLELDTFGMTAWVEGKQVLLTTKEFRLLEYLARNRGRPLAREELLQAVWPNSKSAGPRVVDSHVCRLREKMEVTPTNPAYLHTIHNLGYCLSLPHAHDNR